MSRVKSNQLWPARRTPVSYLTIEIVGDVVYAWVIGGVDGLRAQPSSHVVPFDCEELENYGLFVMEFP